MSVAFNLSRPAYFENLHREQFKYEPAYNVQVFADMVDIKALNAPMDNRAGGTKRKMRGFSSQSRHAMIEFLAKVEDIPQLFVTLTYSDDIAPSWIFHFRHDFELLRKQLEYHYAGVRAMWRLEFKPRKSGKYYGSLIPHFHMLIWLPRDTPQERVEKILEGEGQLWRNAWHKITHSTDEHHLSKYGCKVERIKSRKHAYAYCSKYLAKDDEEEVEAGRRWGRIGEFEQPVEVDTTLSKAQYIQFKRLLNAYIKSEAIKRHKNQRLNIPYPAKPVSYYLKFYRHFVSMNINFGSSVFGLGFISQHNVIGQRTIYRMLRHARELASGD